MGFLKQVQNLEILTAAFFYGIRQALQCSEFVFMPPKVDFRGAYSFLSRLCVCPSARFYVWITLGVLECRILFSGHFDLDLWPQF